MQLMYAVNPFEERAAWASHLQSVFCDLGIEEDSVTGHLSESLAVYCQHYHPNGVQNADLALLISRALCAFGDQATAERVLSSLPTHSRHSNRWLEILSELHQFPELLPYFSKGVIRPADWSGAKLDRMWMLDFERLFLRESERHEIMLYRTVRSLVEKMALFWDATSGEGTIGLSGLSALQVTEEPTRRAKSWIPEEHWLEYIQDILARLAQIRCWKKVPTLLNLNL